MAKRKPKPPSKQALRNAAAQQNYYASYGSSNKPKSYKPPKSQKVSRQQIKNARAQERQHVSQGTAVKRAATPPPAPAPRSDVVVGSGYSKRPTQTRARVVEEYKSQDRNTRAGRAAAGGSSRSAKIVAQVHKERMARAPERLARARRKVEEGRQSARDLEVIKDLTTKPTPRKDLGALKPETTRARVEAPKVHISANNQAERQKLIELEHEGKLKPDALDKAMQVPAKALKVGADVVTRPAAIAAAAYHDPIGVPRKTAKQGLDAIKGAPGGVVEAVRHPVKTVKDMASGMEHRADESFGDTVKRIRKEGGLADVADVATVLPSGGNAAKVITRDVGRGVRPAVRVTGGAAKPQRASHGIIGREAQRAVDTTRARVQRKRVERAEADGKPVPVEVREAEARNRAAGRTVEVTPMAKLGRGRAQRMGVAKPKSRAVARQKLEQSRRVGAQRRAISKLSKQEREAFYHATALGIRDPASAGAQLAKRRQRIEAERASNGVQPKGRFKKVDELDTIAKLEADPHAHFTPKLHQTIEELRNESVRIGREDPRLNARQRINRRYVQQAEHLGMIRNPGEGDAAFAKRVQTEAKAQGLERPLYFPSERYALDDDPDFAAYAVGGARAAARPRKYEGKNFAIGLQDTSPETYLTGLARNIKGKHNWKLVTETLGRNAIRSAPGGSSGGAAVSVLKHWAHEENVDKKSYMLWHPGVFRDEAQAGNPHALGSSLVDPDAVPGNYVDTKGWYAVPRAAADEIMAATKPSGALGRSFDIAKGKQSRALLLAGNVPWLTYQVASNTLIGAAATKGTILPTAVKAQMFKRFKLDKNEREAWESFAGSGQSADVSNHLHLGAAADNSMVNGYRAFKKLPIWHKQPLGRGPATREILNPLEWFAAADRGQNGIFRDAILYDQVKRGALRDMGKNMTRAQASQERLVNLFTLGPEQRMKEIVRNQDALETHADALNDWLGDYSTFTHRERKTMNRFVMFYPYLRYSLKFAFYTMPVKHPAMTGVLANLSELNRQELKQLLGGNGAELPWNAGKIYFNDDGTVKSIDLSKANPALNAITSMTTPTQAYGILPPVLSSLFDQVNTRKLYSGKAWAVEGKPADPFRKAGEYSLGLRGKVFADDLLSTLYPYRTAENLTQSGPQGDDSTLWDPSETHYSDRTWKGKLINKSIEADKQFEEDEGMNGLTAEAFIQQVTPLLPHATRDVGKAKESAKMDRIQARKDRERAAKKKGGGSTKSFGGSSSAKHFGVGG